MRVDIRHRQIAASYMISSRDPEGGGDPFEDSQDMPRIKTGQHAEHPGQNCAGNQRVSDPQITAARHGKQIERLNDMRTKS